MVRDFPLESIHPFALKAAEASQCAREQGKYWEMHDQLFANYQALGPDDLMRHAGSVGLNVDRFQHCLEAGRHAAAIRQDVERATLLGVNGTPFFAVGSAEPGDSRLRVVTTFAGGLAYDGFKQVLDAALKAQQEGNQ